MPDVPRVSERNTGISLRLLFIFNLIDAFLTVMWVNAGIAIEANPLMAAAMTYGMSFFVLVKVSIVSFAIAILWYTRKNKMSGWASLFSASAMGFLVLYHVFGILDGAYL